MCTSGSSLFWHTHIMVIGHLVLYCGCYRSLWFCIDLGFTVQVQLSPQQANPQCADVNIVSFTVLIASKGQPSLVLNWIHITGDIPSYVSCFFFCLCLWAHYSHNHNYTCTCTCHNAYMYLSTAPGVQWLLDHGTAYEGDLNAEESFSLIHLHCYPEIALAVQGTWHLAHMLYNTI